MQFKFVHKNNPLLLPKTAGVYQFSDKDGNILYIGKAINIRDRIKGHLRTPSYRSNLFIDQAENIGFIETNSEIEALILESKLIKKHLPRYNIIWKDDKNYFFVAMTKEDLPRIFITHQPISTKDAKYKFIGPFVDGSALKQTLKYLRKPFPYYSSKTHPKRQCQWCHINLCPGPDPDKKEYRKNIKKLRFVLEGQSDKTLKRLKKEMEILSKNREFERAAVVRDQAVSLERVMFHRHIFKNNQSETEQKEIQNNFRTYLGINKDIKRIEAYDISNIQGKEATGSMIAFANGQPDKNYYRKFRIKLTASPNDTAMIRECIIRRFRHPEWPFPDMILIDGGQGQLNVALNLKTDIPQLKKIFFCALAKRENKLFIEGKREPILLQDTPKNLSNLILYLRDEAHRFALSYHHKLREKDFARN